MLYYDLIIMWMRCQNSQDLISLSIPWKWASRNPTWASIAIRIAMALVSGQRLHPPPPPWARPGRLIHYKSSKTFQPIAVDWLKLDWVWCQVVSAICRLEWSWTRVSDMLSAPVHCQLSISKRCSSLLRWFLLGFSFSFFLNFFVVFRYPHLLATNR